ncbi:hypothetical protein VD0002_g9447 [Verticillium dahliae]|uniref:Signal peptide-containing protein n=1 Tax=Verticillium dahliae TaxID=27337 RepID=A0A2J8CTK3_VERDA|nr:Putative aspartic-type endopeptidase OPSB [Verticillium dahliae VDG2]PNH29188.1 hypothetical protein BJF96_g7459 [Verticillium dahliae]PNH40356.1 hypothetical protein VD0004_g6627 [Verticillium dahliae]PNH46147.1 hypothetical protein VD0003_g9069 [Verticillium dahliae]PNH58077.1 hypothetical protein VD0002_g9447 [Verticillium dahliae]
MSLPVAIRSVIFYYLACTPCNDAKGRYRAKQKAEKDRENKATLEMEQPGLYAHPSPWNTNPYWQEEIDIGPKLPKKTGHKNSSQRGLHSAGTSAGRDSTSASLTATSSNLEHSTTGRTSPTIIPEDDGTRISGDGWNKTRYQREDEELWGGDLSKMGHKLVDNIVKAGNSAGRMIKGELSKERQVTEEERRDFYFTPKNPPVNEYHPPIVGSTPVHKNALQWMLQPPPTAKLMEGRVPVSRAKSSSSVASRGSRASKASRAATTEDTPLGRIVREKALQEKLRKQETPSETELIDALIGSRSRQTLVSTRGRSMRSRSLSLESEMYSEPSTDSELVERRKHARRQPKYQDADGSSDDEDLDALRQSRDSLRARGSTRVAARPRLGTIRSSGTGHSTPRAALAAKPTNTRAESITPQPSSPTAPAKAYVVSTTMGKHDENQAIPAGF